jgi:hypothetical protein
MTMNTLGRKLIGLLVLAAVALSSLAVSAPAYASRQGRRNTATALSAAALYELLRGHTATGLVLGGGSYYAWQRANERDHHRHYRHYRHHYYRENGY